MFSSYLAIIVIIGFTDTSYTVDESIGTLQVDLQVLNVSDNQPLLASESIDLYIQSISKSASKCTEPMYHKVLMHNLRIC